jgi:hypothetical protein
MKIYLILFFLLTLSVASKAQAEEEKEEEQAPRIDLNFQLKNMHYWRGYAVTTSPMLASNVYYQSPNGQWRAGVWGGMSFNGLYREFDYYISYQYGRFSAALWDIYNFSSPEISGRGFFDYNNRTTGRFIDFTLAYQFGEKFPLQLSASTILHGRDSEMSPTLSDPYQRTGLLRYTTFIETRYPLVRNPQYELDGFIAGSVALAGATETFYANRRGINFVGVQFRKTVKFGNYSIPVQATPAWNPNAGHAFLEVAITFF